MQNKFNINFYKLVLEEINQELNDYCNRFYSISSKDSAQVTRCKKALNDLIALQDKFENDETAYNQVQELIEIWLDMKSKIEREEDKHVLHEAAEEIEVTIYGKVKKFKNAKECKKYFNKLLDTCDPESSEADRYYYIFECLDAGKTKINADDQNDYTESEISEILNWIESLSK